MGLDLTKGTIRNNLEAGVIEPAMSKVKIIQVIQHLADNGCIISISISKFIYKIGIYN